MAPRDMLRAARLGKADIMLSGGRTQFIALKAKTPWLDINQERHEPFAGYDGMVELVRKIDPAINNPVWEQVRAPAPWDRLSEAHVRALDVGEDFVARTRRKFAATAADDLGEC